MSEAESCPHGEDLRLLCEDCSTKDHADYSLDMYSYSQGKATMRDCIAALKARVNFLEDKIAKIEIFDAWPS